MPTAMLQTFRYAPAAGAQARSLLDMFSPKFADPRPRATAATVDGTRQLWAADTLHRANNLAQMFVSLGYAAPRLGGAIDANLVAGRAALLAEAYADLASEGSAESLLPCGPILERIVVGLVRLFAEGVGPLVLRMQVDPLMLPKHERRALVLIASELVINALKYAFRPGESGDLAVSLTVSEDLALLTVQDSGPGLSGLEPPGDGVQILDQLAALLGATTARSSPTRGLRAQIGFRPW